MASFTFVMTARFLILNRLKNCRKRYDMSDDNILIVGGGLAGIKSALELAVHNIPVTIIDKSPFFSGKLSQLDKQFPTNSCTMCQMLPLTNELGTSEFCLKRELNNPNITLFPQTEILSYQKTEAGFTVELKHKPKFVDNDKCIVCHKCSEVCPEKTDSEYEEKLIKRKAIYQLFPNSIPNSYVIDPETCTKCEKCVKVCPTNAINLNAKEEIKKQNFKNIIISAGFELYDPAVDTEYGFGRFKNVFT
ncbi:MAG TPA: CoB--CoM heterodisulfide reductase iron-sulfur subunit A family protein, partial [Firmicutes bacterium]|nr:CoB--CoM heterodisulfide reductase iron-sulfur subunit A family protein [Bacillota bacterium]